MADKAIGELPAASSVRNDSLIPLEQQGTAMYMTGAHFAAWAKQNAQFEAERAIAAADRADAAVVHTPYIQDGMWMVWQQGRGYVNTQIAATGPQGIQGNKGDKGDKGDIGPQGERGLNGVAVSTSGTYAFNVNDAGHLILYYTGNTAPDFSINQNGHLIWNYS